MKSCLFSIEPLESRIAPAGVTVVGKTATWTDWDGDLVTLKWTGSVAPNFSHFHTPTGAVANGIVLDEIIFSNPNDAITVSVKAAPGGDGRVDLGYMNATGLPLKSFIAPKASVLEFDCGDTHNAIGTLQIAGYGTVEPGAFTTPGGNGTGYLDGKVGAVKIAGDFDYGDLDLGDQVKQSPVGSVSIGGNLNGNVANPVADTAGRIDVEGPLGQLTVRGNVLGGAAEGTGYVNILEEYKTISIGGDVIGGTVGGTGIVQTYGDLPSGVISIGGSVIGGSGESSGAVRAESLSSLTVGGNLEGGSQDETGNVIINSPSVKITVKGSVIGGAVVNAKDDFETGTIEIFDVTQGSASIIIGHNLIAGTASGGTVTYNGAVLVDGHANLASLSIGGSIEGTNAFRAFVLVKGSTPAKAGSFDAIGRITVGGSVDDALIAVGQDYENSFGVSPSSGNLGMAENPDAGIGAVTIGGNWWHSSLMAGVNDGGRLGVDGNEDTQSVGDATRFAVLGPVVIKGYVLDDAASSGYSGFEAEQIAKITAGGQTMFKHGDPTKYFDFSENVFAYEIAAT